MQVYERKRIVSTAILYDVVTTDVTLLSVVLRVVCCDIYPINDAMAACAVLLLAKAGH